MHSGGEKSGSEVKNPHDAKKKIRKQAGKHVRSQELSEMSPDKEATILELPSIR